VVILAAIPAAAIALGRLGRYGLSAALYAGVSSYVAGIVLPLVVALVLERIAPRFQSDRSFPRALKLVAYAWTPLWIVGVVYLIFFLTPLVLIAGIYAIYLFYAGLPVLLKTTYDKVVPFMVVSAIAVLVVSIVLSSVLAAIGLPQYGF
jgi:hypothetical protein